MNKLHIGCGKRNFGEDWYHIDGNDYPHVQWQDITRLPFGGDTVDLIYASHVIEYFDREEIRGLLQEWVHSLKPGGTLRLAVPNFAVIAKLYTEGKYPLDNFIGPLYGKWKVGDNYCYHKTVYDFDSLKTVLEGVGLRNVRRWKWRQVDHGKFDDHSQAYLPHMDKDSGQLISLNVEAVK